MTRRSRGQALLEMALALPVLLVLCWGAYASMRTAVLISRAESAVLTESLRSGRGLPGIGKELVRSISTEENAVFLRSGPDGKSRGLPVPFPRMSGRTKARAEVRKHWSEIGDPEWLPPANILRSAEVSVDCWGKNTSSGRNLRRWVTGRVLLGALR